MKMKLNISIQYPANVFTVFYDIKATLFYSRIFSLNHSPRGTLNCFFVFLRHNFTLSREGEQIKLIY